jgi:hypothetical protein
MFYVEGYSLRVVLLVGGAALRLSLRGSIT